MKLLNKGSFLDIVERDHHPDKRSRKIRRDMFQSAYFYNNNHMV